MNQIRIAVIQALLRESAEERRAHVRELADQIRAELPLLAHRRTDVYRLERLGGR